MTGEIKLKVEKSAWRPNFAIDGGPVFCTIDPMFTSLERAKGLYDDCKTIDEMIDRHVERINYLRQLKEAGIQLSDTVADDYAFLETDNSEVAAKFGFEEDEE